MARAGTARAVATVKAGETKTVTLSDQAAEAPELRAVVKPLTEAKVPYVEGLIRLPGQGSFAISARVDGKADDSKNAYSRVVGSLNIQVGEAAGFMEAKGSGRLVYDGTGTAYQLMRLLPGRYLIYVLDKDQLVNWRWTAVAKGAKLRLDFSVDPRDEGSLEVALPAGVKDQDVSLVPLDRDGKVPTPLPKAAKEFFAWGLPSATTKAGRTRFGRLAPARISPGLRRATCGRLPWSRPVKPRRLRCRPQSEPPWRCSITPSMTGSSESGDARGFS